MDGLSGNHEEHSPVGLLLGRPVPEVPEGQGQVEQQIQVRPSVNAVSVRHVVPESSQATEQARPSAVNAWKERKKITPIRN